MARKKPTRSRVQQYKAQRRKSWARFLTKITLFFVPVIVLTIGLIIFILPSGNELPILVLDLETKEERTSGNAWKRISYGISDTDKGIQVPSTTSFGGPGKDVLVVFNDLLGSARPIKDGGPETACVFVPKTPEEHHTHAFRGLLHDESTEETEQWKSFDEYVQSLIGEIKVIRDKIRDEQVFHVILAFDIDHPDLPGRLPPQANSFIKLCRQEWEEPETGTRADLASLAPNLEVHIWLSHSEGQMSYYDSDYAQVESFFKRRFERGVTGDVIEVASGSDDIQYSDLKKYVRGWVETDADIHKLAQTPVFLEPQGFDETAEGFDETADFSVLRRKNLERQENGALFNYVARTNDVSLGFDSLWKRLNDVKTSHHWTLENPLLIQRSAMILLQMEKLWYAGRGNSLLFDNLKRSLELNLTATTTIDPVKHTLYDALAKTPDKNIEPLNLDLLIADPIAEPADSTSGDDELAKQAEAVEAQREKAIAAWKSAHPDWNRALSVWQSICGTQKIGINQPTIVAALELLDENQKQVSRPESFAEVDDLTNVYWTEIGYLHRLADELVWPTKDATSMEELVLLSIKTRDRCNRLAAELTPTLVSKFDVRINELENQRRQNEDRLFANDHASLRSDFKQLEAELLEIEKKHRKLKSNFERLQQQLVAAPHDFRYCLESVAVVSRGEQTEAVQKQIADFEKWNSSDDGFLSNWPKIGNHEIGKLIERTDDDDEIQKLVNRVSAFEKARTNWYAATDKTDFATNPYVDFAKYSDNPDSLGAADGNLLGRRLLLWPGLDRKSRDNIREGLSTNKVTWSGGIQPSLDFDNQEFADRLATFFQDERLRILTRLSTDEIALKPGDENYFTRVAYRSHQLLAQPDDATAQNLAVGINDFRCRKSDFDLQRVAGDLWATPLASSQDPFVTSALNNHSNLVDARIQNFPDRLNSTREKLAEIWEAGPKRDWPTRIQEVKDFCEDFPSRNWRWDRNRQKAINADIAPDIERETPKGMPLIFALSTRDAPFESIFNGTFELDNNWIDPKVVSGDSLRVYLRGHKAEFGVARAPVPLKPVSFDIVLKNYNVPGAQLIVKRANPGPVSGHITIVIDCSNSMETAGRMNSAKQNVNQFLDFIKDRADISVSLVAIGAGERFTGTSWKKRPRQGLSKWERNQPSDVWFFAENGKVVNKVIDKNSIDQFKAAIAQLEFFGDTPILAGLNAAIDAIPSEANRPKLVVLLTDGFEFGHRKEREDSEPFAAFDNNLYIKIGKQLKAEKLELVVFSFLTQSIAEEFDGMLKQGVAEAEIKQRIARIRKLATINKQASETTLQKFFAGLLPKPYVVVKDEGESRLVSRREVEDGFDLDRDGKKSDEELRIMQAIELGADENPDEWSVGMEFAQEAKDNAAESFSQAPSAWSSETKVAGNEKLEFEYDPLLSTFDLTTDSSSLADARVVEFGKHPLLVGTASNIRKKPGFQLASQNKSELTPSPALAFLTMEPSDNRDNIVLVQDFNLKRQTRSNVHPLEFPEFKDELREANFRKQSVNMNLHLIPKFTPQFWTKIYFNLADQMKVQNDQERKQTVKQGVFVGIGGLFPKSNPYNKYEIQIRRENQTDLVIYSIRISSKDGVQPLDRWLVQVLDADGNINRTINESTRRTYIFRKDSSGPKELMAIEHHFSIIKSELKGSKAAFGFSHIDHFENVNVSKIEYPEYFSRN